MDLVGQEPVENVPVRRVAVVDGDVGLLGEVVVETRRPLSGAQARRCGTVVDHVRDALEMHVRVEGVHAFDDRFVADLGIGMALLGQNVHLGDHGGAIDPGGEGVDRNLFFHAPGADRFADLPHPCTVDLADGETSLVGGVHAADFVPVGHVVVDFKQNFQCGLVGRAVGLPKLGLAAVVKVFVEAQDAVVGNAP